MKAVCLYASGGFTISNFSALCFLLVYNEHGARTYTHIDMIYINIYIHTHIYYCRFGFAQTRRAIGTRHCSSLSLQLFAKRTRGVPQRNLARRANHGGAHWRRQRHAHCQLDAPVHCGFGNSHQGMCAFLEKYTCLWLFVGCMREYVF